MKKNKLYLRVDKLKTFDVILTRIKKPAAIAVAKLTNGQYSHAALVACNYIIFESTNKGLLYKPLKIDKVEDHGNYYRILHEISSYKKIAVYRQPDIINPNHCFFELLDILRPFNGLEYPQLYKLANTTKFLSKYPRIKTNILRVMDYFYTHSEKKIIPGPFCSQLVYIVLTELNIDIFHIPKLPNTVSPNDFANPNISKMEKVKEMFCEEDSSIDNNDEEQEKINKIAMHYIGTPLYTKHFVGLRKLVAKMKRKKYLFWK